MAKIIDNYLDRHVSKLIQKANEEKEAAHVSSGKLSASGLGNPLQWQILKSLGVPGKAFDEYTLRKFKRGNDIEDWFVKTIPEPVALQEPVSYRDCGGVVDAIVDTKDWDFPIGVVPLEVKSTSNANFKWIVKGGPKRGHCLQGTLYALAKGVDKFALTYIAADDYRIHTYIINAEDYRGEVDAIITRYDEQKASGIVPVFEPEEDWQANVKYNNYPDWSQLDQEGVNKKLEEFLKTKNLQTI